MNIFLLPVFLDFYEAICELVNICTQSLAPHEKYIVVWWSCYSHVTFSKWSCDMSREEIEANKKKKKNVFNSSNASIMCSVFSQPIWRYFLQKWIKNNKFTINSQCKLYNNMWHHRSSSRVVCKKNKNNIKHIWNHFQIIGK